MHKVPGSYMDQEKQDIIAEKRSEKECHACSMRFEGLSTLMVLEIWEITCGRYCLTPPIPIEATLEVKSFWPM